jgi:hypothetical protein
VSADGVIEVKYLVMLFEFEDLKHTKSFEEIRRIAIDEVREYFDEVSYGKVRAVGDIRNWTKNPVSVKNLDVFRWNLNWDDMWKIDNKSLELIAGYEPKASEYPIMFVVYAGKVWGHAYERPKASFVNEFYGASTYSHELGHIIGLPDLYSYKASQEGKYSGVNVGPWDLMATSSQHVHFTSYSKLRLEWIDKQKMADVKGSLQGTFTIDPIEDRNGKLLLVRVFLSDVQAYYVEVRARIGVDAKLDRRMRMGMLVIFWDGRLDPKEGGVIVMDSHPNSYSSGTPWAELFDAPFSLGRNETSAFINREKNLSIIALSKTGNSYKIMISDTVNGEKAIEANSIIGQAEEAIAKAEGESRLKGLDDARSQLGKATSAYAEGQFHNSISAAKSAIELANAATTMPTTTTATPTVAATTTRPATTETSTTPTSPSITVTIAVVGIVALVAVGALVMLRRSKKTGIQEPQRQGVS